MKYLDANYYIAITEKGKIIARFTKAEDAYHVLPSFPRCFASPVHVGKVIFINQETKVFSSERACAKVYESLTEYYEDKKAMQRQLHDKEEDQDREL